MPVCSRLTLPLGEMPDQVPVKPTAPQPDRVD